MAASRHLCETGRAGKTSLLVEIRPERNAAAENSGEIVREDRQANVSDQAERVLIVRCVVCDSAADASAAYAHDEKHADETLTGRGLPTSLQSDDSVRCRTFERCRRVVVVSAH